MSCLENANLAAIAFVGGGYYDIPVKVRGYVEVEGEVGGWRLEVGGES